MPTSLSHRHAHLHQISVLTLTATVLFSLSGITFAQNDTRSVSMVELTGEGAQYWPRWRGPSGQGIVSTGNYPDHWTATDNVLWRTSLSGQGNSSPIVWGDYIILTSGREAGQQLFVQAYRRSDGTLRWETEVAPGRPERVHSKNGPASATPTTDGKRIFASLGGRGIVALDFDGNILWHSTVGSINNYRGPAGSPLLYDDLLIVYQDQRGGGFSAAYDTATGNEVWRTARDASVGWGSPIVIRVGDHDELIISSQNTVNAYNPRTGDELWRCGGNLFEVIPTPVVEAGLIFCASGRAGPTLAIRPGGQGDVTDTHIAWSTSRGSPFVPSPVAYDGYLYTINDMSSIITCFDAATGTVMWQQRLGRATREGISSSPVVVNDKVFVTNDDGTTFVLKTGPEFELLHTNNIGAQTLASPALVDDTWYMRTVDELIAVGH